MGCSFHKSGEISARFESIMEELSDQGSACYVTDNGRPRAVLMDLDKYHAMMDIIETQGAPDLSDLDPGTVRALLKDEADA